jgi:CheY-like chemotaxis protein
MDELQETHGPHDGRYGEARQALHEPLVLVIEDDDALREEVADLLVADGYQVLQASSGRRGLEVLRSTPHVDLVLLDLWMPDLDGGASRAEQRRDQALSHVPVIILTADGSAQARAIDSAAFLRKPFEAQKLSTTVRRVLAQYRTDTQRTAGAVTETVALLAGAICHEVADPLMTLIAGLEKARARGGFASGNGDATVNVDDMLTQCWRIAEALRTLRDLPCPPWASEREADVGQLVRAALAWTGSERIDFQSDPGTVAIVHGDPLVIVYVCTSILHNAVESTPLGPKADSRNDGGSDADPDAPRVRVRLLSTADEVILDVRDGGPRIPDEELHRVFSVQYPGRAKAWSTGLRLWLVRQAVEGLGGAIEVTNEESGGVRCRIRLPTAKPSSRASRSPSSVRIGAPPAAERNM